MSRDSSPLRGCLIFIVGARRSGTNWLQRIVGAHPAVASVPSETYLFSHGLQPLVERFHHGLVGSGQTGFVYMDRDAMLDGLRDFADAVFEGLRATLDPGAERIVERTPDHVRHLGLMGDVYPDAMFLHIVRDGRDVARSLRSQPWGPSSIAEAAEEWRSAIEGARQASSGLQHYIELGYEELLSDPRAGIERVFSWLSLDADPRTVEGTLLEAKVRFNVDPQAPAVAEGKWRKEFSPEDIAAFEKVAGSTLSELGYAPSDAAPAPTPAPVPASGRATASPARRSPPRLSARIRRLLGGGRPDRVGKEIRVRQRACQIVVDRFLDAAARGAWGEMEDLLTESVHVRLVDRGGAWQGRGPEARAKLADTLASDRALRGRQVRGDVHPSLPTYTVVAAYRVDDGEVLDRVWTITVEGERVGRVGYYGLPTGDAPEK